MPLTGQLPQQMCSAQRMPSPGNVPMGPPAIMDNRPFRERETKEIPEGLDQAVRWYHLNRSRTTHYVRSRRTMPVRCLDMIGAPCRPGNIGDTTT